MKKIDILNFLSKDKIIFFAIFVAIFVVVVLIFSISLSNMELYSSSAKQTEAFSNFRISILDKNGISQPFIDAVPYNGRYYSPLSPIPALFYTPMMFILKFSSERFFYLELVREFTQLIFTAVIYFLLFQIARKFKYAKTDSFILAFIFCFASVFFNTALYHTDWSEIQVFTTLFIVLAVYEFFNRKRFFLIGVYLALVLGLRAPAAGVYIFFLLEILFSELKSNNKIKQLAKLTSPLVVMGFLLLLYNYIRFDNFFDNGYMTALIYPDFQILMREKYGLFNLSNIPTNLYWYFFATPSAVFAEGTYHLIKPYFKISPVGLSFFILSPIFIKIFYCRIIEKRQIFLWISSAIILFVLLSYYASGFLQLGPRYIIDLLPIWFLLLLYSFPNRKLKLLHIIFVVFSVNINLYLFLLFNFQ